MSLDGQRFGEKFELDANSFITNVRILISDRFRCVLLDIWFGLERRKTDDQMRVFNGISHSFGVSNLQNHVLFLLHYMEEELRVLKRI